MLAIRVVSLLLPICVASRFHVIKLKAKSPCEIIEFSRNENDIITNEKFVAIADPNCNDLSFEWQHFNVPRGNYFAAVNPTNKSLDCFWGTQAPDLHRYVDSFFPKSSKFISLAFRGSGKSRRFRLKICAVGGKCPHQFNDCQCGKRNNDNFKPTIIGGSNALKNEFPWMASLKFFGRFHFCGGSLIADTWVITAAHCVTRMLPYDITVVLGEHDLKDFEDKTKIIEVLKIYQHPKYSRYDSNWDMSLLKLKQRVELTREISPVCLPLNNDDDFTGAKATISGWGLTSNKSIPDILQKVDGMDILANENCGLYPPGVIMENMLCSSSKGKDTCQGDSGGPLTVDIDDKWTLAGITSFGRSCADENYPGVYARVSKGLPWIRQIVGEKGLCI